MSDADGNPENSFIFERALKVMLPFIDTQSLDLLTQWKISEGSLHNAWREFRIYPSDQTVSRLKLRMTAWIDMADQIRATLLAISMNIPHPDSASHIWDAGRKKNAILAREQAIDMIRQYINNSYETMWQRLAQIQPLIDSPSEHADSDIDGDSSVHTVEGLQEETHHSEPTQMQETGIQTLPLADSAPVPDKVRDVDSSKSGSRLIFHDDDFI